MSMIINNILFNDTEQWQIDYIKKHFNDKITDIEKAVGFSDWKIDRLMKALDIKRTRHWHRVIPDTPEVLADLANPYLSHVKIADKYNCTPDAVAQQRKRRGLSVRRSVSRTRLEEKIAVILDELDIAYHEQKRIDKWSVDFYLGDKTIVDVHGEYIHSKDIAKERDKNKKSFLEKSGYLYIEILEKDIDNGRKILVENLKDKFKWLKIQ